MPAVAALRTLPTCAGHFGRSSEVLGPAEVRDSPRWAGPNSPADSLWQTAQDSASVLSPEEVLRLIDAAPGGRDRMLLRVGFGCGLRLSELLHLRVTDIDSARAVIHVHRGKGGKVRLVPLSMRLLGELRAYWQSRRPRIWRFPG
jgi:integrase